MFLTGFKLAGWLPKAVSVLIDKNNVFTEILTVTRGLPCIMFVCNAVMGIASKVKTAL